MFILTNPQTGNELKIRDETANKFFGVKNGEKKFICLPCGSDITLANNTVLSEINIKKYTHKKKISGTCVIRMGGLGDLILLSSGLRELIKRTGKDRLTFCTLNVYKPFMRRMGFQCISIEDLGKYEFDKVIDLRFSVEPKELGNHCKGIWDSYMTEDRSDLFDKLLGVYPCPKKFIIPENQKTTHKMKKIVGEGFILICASMVAAARSIIPCYIKPLCGKILNRIGGKIVLIGQSQKWNQELKEISGDGIINLIDRTSIDELISLCRLSFIVITPDTGVLHVAGALNKKTLALFGNINPRTRISYYPNIRPLYPHGKLDCIPCGDLHPCMGEPQIGSKCMKIITPKKIIDELVKIC